MSQNVLLIPPAEFFCIKKGASPEFEEAPFLVE